MTAVRMRRIGAGFAVVATAWTVVFGSAAGATTVGAEEYTQTVCGAIAPFAALTEQLGVGFQQAVDAYKAQPSEATATALRQALVALLDQSAQAVDQITDSARTAGTPDVKHGAQFAAAVVKHIGATADALHDLATQAGGIGVASGTRFAGDFQRVANKVDTVEKRLAKLSKRDAAFKNAAAPLRPIVVFMTTDAPGCPT